MAKKQQQSPPTRAAADPATPTPAAPDLTAMLQGITDPQVRARLQAELAGQVAWAVALEKARREAEERTARVLAKILSVVTPEDLGNAPVILALMVEDGKVVGNIAPKEPPPSGRAATWTPERKAELAKLLRAGKSKAEAAAELGVSVSSVGNCIYSNGKNVKGFLAECPAE